MYTTPQQKNFNKPAEAFMPFGSLCNMYAQVNQGKGMTATELAREADILYEKANELVQRGKTAEAMPQSNVPTFKPEPEIEL